MKEVVFILILCSGGVFASCQQTPSSKVKATTKDDVAYRDYKTYGVPKEAIDALAQVRPEDAAKLDALNITEFASAMPDGAEVQPNARVSSNEDTARGTNVAPAINAAIKAAKIGQFVIIGPGEWVVSTPINLPGNKGVNLICSGNLHFNKRDGFRITAPSVGRDPQHHLFFYGSLIGSENLPRHTKQTTDAGMQPKWDDMKNTAIDITNCSRNFVLINRAEGFGNAVRINGEKGDGSQENTISFQYLYKNANGITLRSVDGRSYVDKNRFMGFYGGAGRIGGGLAINIDGFEGIAHNGERYNGSFSSNEFHFLVEQVDRIIIANADVREPIFDIIIEAGDKTGVYAPDPIQLRSEGPNVVRSPKFVGGGFLTSTWLTKGLGVNGLIIGLPIYYNNYALLGTNGRTDEKGNLIMDGKVKVPKAIKDKLPKNIRIAD